MFLRSIRTSTILCSPSRGAITFRFTSSTWKLVNYKVTWLKHTESQVHIGTFFLQNFFRRAVVHKLKYECKNGSNCCSVQSGHRPRCQYCRMTKCREMGMKDEYINRMGRNRKRHMRLTLTLCNITYVSGWFSWTSECLSFLSFEFYSFYYLNKSAEFKQFNSSSHHHISQVRWLRRSLSLIFSC